MADYENNAINKAYPDELPLEKKNISKPSFITGIPNIDDLLEESHCLSRYSKGETLLYHQEVKLTYMEIVKLSSQLGCISFGGPAANLCLIKEILVNQRKNISQEKFDHLLSVCVLLPGYSSSNLLAAICTINTGSIWGGVLGLTFFNIPSLIALLLITSIVNLIKFGIRPEVSNYNPDAKYFDIHNEPFLFILMALGAGIVQAALGILIQSTSRLSKKLANSTFQLSLLLIAGCLFYVYDSYLFIILIMIACGIISTFKGDHDYLLYPTLIPDKDWEGIPYTGNLCIILLAVFFTLVSTVDYFLDNIYTFLAESFVRMGAICVGEGHVIIPMILSEYNNKKLLEEAEVLNGYAIVSLLPGSLLNTASYVGVMCTGIFGGLISGIMIFIPGFLIMLFALPNLERIKSSHLFQHFIRGANSAAMGFLFAAAIKLWIDSCFVNPYSDPILGTLNVLLCYMLAEEFQLHLPYIILIGAGFNLVQTVIDYFFAAKN